MTTQCLQDNITAKISSFNRIFRCLHINLSNMEAKIQTKLIKNNNSNNIIVELIKIIKAINSNSSSQITILIRFRMRQDKILLSKCNRVAATFNQSTSILMKLMLMKLLKMMKNQLWETMVRKAQLAKQIDQYKEHFHFIYRNIYD